MRGPCATCCGAILMIGMVGFLFFLKNYFFDCWARGQVLGVWRRDATPLTDETQEEFSSASSVCVWVEQATTHQFLCCNFLGVLRFPNRQSYCSVFIKIVCEFIRTKIKFDRVYSLCVKLHFLLTQCILFLNQRPGALMRCVVWFGVFGFGGCVPIVVVVG